MEKTRVKKGEKYWYIASDFFAGDFYIVYGIDFYEDIHDGRFALGNYFHTKEEAESMADKLRRVLKGVWVIDPHETESFAKKVEAVLNGADVIEMPSEDEIESEVQDSAFFITSGHDRIYAVDGVGKILCDTTYEEIADKLRGMVEWIKSKIIK